MVHPEVPPRSADPARLALGLVATAHVAAVVFTESYRSLPVVVSAYAAGWLVVRRAAS